METVTFHRQTLVGFVIGVVVTLVAALVFLNAWRVDAAPGDTDTTLVPMTPCRLIDTRPGEDRVGPHGGFGIEDSKTITAHGTNGDCTIPTDAVGLSLNVTALDAIAPSFLTVWPDGERPEASSLNPVPGQPPIPNAVTTTLSNGGSFEVFNLAGTVNVIIDVNGYHTKASLQELASRLTAAEAAIADKANSATLDQHVTDLEAADAALEAAQPFAVSAFNRPTIAADVLETPTAFVSVSVTAPVAGQVTINSTASIFENLDGKRLVCAIYETSDIPAETIEKTPSFQGWQTGGNGRSGTLSGTRTFDIAAGATISYSLACEKRENTTAFLASSNLTAVFTPAP